MYATSFLRFCYQKLSEKRKGTHGGIHTKQKGTYQGTFKEHTYGVRDGQMNGEQTASPSGARGGKHSECTVNVGGNPVADPGEIAHFLLYAGVIFAEFNIHSQAFKSVPPPPTGLDPPLEPTENPWENTQGCVLRVRDCWVQLYST